MPGQFPLAEVAADDAHRPGQLSAAWGQQDFSAEPGTLEAVHESLVRGDRLEYEEIADQGCAVGRRERVDRPRCQDRLAGGRVPADALDVVQRAGNPGLLGRFPPGDSQCLALRLAVSTPDPQAG